MAGEREAIATQHCGSCIHDYHDDWRTDIVEQHVVGADVIRRLGGVTQPVRGLFPGTTTSSASPSRVLVLGWYGTETIGDMAILAGLVEEYRQVRPETVFVVPSYYPDYTRHDLARLGLDCVTTSYDNPEAIGDLWNCQTVIIGGGPLMDIPQITWLASIFERARALGRRTIIEGCGIGPVNSTATAAAIERIAGVADEIRVRDAESALQLRALGADGVIEVVADPAARWARRRATRHRPSDHGPICVFARELTDEYPQATTPEEATLALSEFLRRLADWYPDRAIRLHAMHHFPVGGDDRLYGRRLATIISRSNISVDEIPRRLQRRSTSWRVLRSWCACGSTRSYLPTRSEPRCLRLTTPMEARWLALRENRAWSAGWSRSAIYRVWVGRDLPAWGSPTRRSLRTS